MSERKSEWQPIETAPRDGTAVLLWSPLWEMSWGIQTGYFSDCEWHCGEGSVADNGHLALAEIDDDDDVDLDAIEGPSHWHPLPAPPESKP